LLLLLSGFREEVVLVAVRVAGIGSRSLRSGLVVFGTTAALPFGPELPVLPESFCERIVVDLQLRDPVVLVGRDSEEGRFRKRVTVVGRELEADQIVGLNHVNAGDVLVH
jgi:hypothetical protein